jgi:hypothetical protein
MAKRKPATAQPSESEREEIAALETRLKQLRGEPTTAAATKHLDKWNRNLFESIREQSLRSLPKGVYCGLAGRQQKVVDEFGVRYDVPLIGPTVDLFAVIQTLHSRISELAAAARPFQDADDAELHREKLRQEIKKLERQSEQLTIDIRTKLAELVRKEDVREKLAWLSGKMQSLGARMHRIAGEEGTRALNEFLEDVATELDGGTLAV